MNTSFFTKAGKAIVDHLPGILTGFSIVSSAGAIVLAVSATPTAIEHIEEKKAELGEEKLTFKQKVEATWKDYIPSAAMFAASAGMSIGSLSVSNRRIVGLSATYELREAFNGEYREKVRELLGPEKEAEVNRDAQRSFASDYKVGEITPSKGSEDLFCLDGRYFWSTRNNIDASINRLNATLNRGEDVTLNDIYYEFGLTREKGPLHGRNYADYMGFSCEDERTGCPEQIEIGYEGIISGDGKSGQSIYFVIGPHRLS